MSSDPFIFGVTRVRVVSFREQDHAAFRPGGGTFPIEYDIATGAALDEERGEVVVTVSVGVDTADPTEEARSEPIPEAERTRVVEIVAASTFHVANLDVYRQEGRVVLPARTLAILVGIALSTTRGLLIGRSRQRIVGEAPLPVLSPMGVVQDLAEHGDWIGPVPASDDPDD